MAAFADRYGRYAVITGASRGIGAEFARQLAQRGLDLVLVARQADLMDKLAGTLTTEFGVDVRIVAVDLLREDAVDEVLQQTKSLNAGLLVSNAGMGTAGPFLRAAAQEHTEAALVNAIRPMQLAHAFGQRLAAQRRGGIILVTSMSGQLPAACQASYAASKGLPRVPPTGAAGPVRRIRRRCHRAILQGRPIPTCCATRRSNGIN